MVPDIAGQVPQDSKSLEGLNLPHLSHNQHVTTKDTPSIQNHLLYTISVTLFKLIRKESLGFWGGFLGGGSNSYLLNFFYSSLT